MFDVNEDCNNDFFLVLFILLLLLLITIIIIYNKYNLSLFVFIIYLLCLYLTFSFDEQNHNDLYIPLITMTFLSFHIYMINTISDCFEDYHDLTNKTKHSTNDFKNFETAFCFIGTIQ